MSVLIEILAKPSIVDRVGASTLGGDWLRELSSSLRQIAENKTLQVVDLYWIPAVAFGDSTQVLVKIHAPSLHSRRMAEELCYELALATHEKRGIDQEEAKVRLHCGAGLSEMTSTQAAQHKQALAEATN